MTKRSRFVCLVLVAAVFLAACGGEDSLDSSGSESTEALQSDTETTAEATTSTEAATATDGEGESESTTSSLATAGQDDLIAAMYQGMGLPYPTDEVITCIEQEVSLDAETIAAMTPDDEFVFGIMVLYCDENAFEEFNSSDLDPRLTAEQNSCANRAAIELLYNYRTQPELLVEDVLPPEVSAELKAALVDGCGIDEDLAEELAQ